MLGGGFRTLYKFAWLIIDEINVFILFHYVLSSFVWDFTLVSRSEIRSVFFLISHASRYRMVKAYIEILDDIMLSWAS